MNLILIVVYLLTQLSYQPVMHSEHHVTELSAASMSGDEAERLSDDVVMTLDGDVLTGFSLPRFGATCHEVTQVRGGPSTEYAILYSLPYNTVVPIREQPRFANRDWVMIHSAQWVQLSDLYCED